MLQHPHLYPKQYAAMTDAARFTIVEGATKSGKTSSAIVWLVSAAMWGGPGNYSWTAPVYAQAKVAFKRARAYLRRASEWAKANETSYTLELRNGARLAFQTGDKPDNLFGDDANAAVIDEASRIKSDAIDAVISTLTATSGKLLMIGNVRGRRNEHYALARLAEAGEPNYAYHKLTAWDAVDGGVVKRDDVLAAQRLFQMRGREALFRELYLCEPSDDEGNPFGMAHIRACATDALSDGEPAAFGVDIAKQQDWFVVIGLDADGAVCRFDRWQKLDYPAAARRAAAMIGDRPALIDRTGVGVAVFDSIAELCPRAKPFTFTGASKQELMGDLAAALHGRAVSYPSGVIADELSTMVYAVTTAQGRAAVRYQADVGSHDDCVDALALAVRCRADNPTDAPRQWITRTSADASILDLI